MIDELINKYQGQGQGRAIVHKGPQTTTTPMGQDPTYFSCASRVALKLIYQPQIVNYILSESNQDLTIELTMSFEFSYHHRLEINM